MDDEGDELTQLELHMQSLLNYKDVAHANFKEKKLAFVTSFCFEVQLCFFFLR